ncbi:hypothetical protein DB346_05305 [Verrucomicrobia bacterium LW23]|nr:hypothetical protein DB346_05305 [Verrucomicrobia bacterium LW23]
MATLVVAIALTFASTGCAPSDVNRPTVTATGKTLEHRTAERLAAVEVAWREVQAKPTEGSRKKYRAELETFLVYLADLKKLPEWKGTLTIGGRLLDIPRPPAGYSQYDISWYDSFRISSQVAIKSMKKPGRVEGLGAPIVLRKHSSNEPYVFRTGLNSPATAVLDFGGARPTLRFFDPREQPKYEGSTLAADYAAPVEVAINVSEFRDIMFGGVFRVDKFMKTRGLYLTEPYRADKIPVVFVHGLQSSPLTWTQMISSLNAHPELSRKYQFWFYTYPTGSSWIISAPAFRDDLNGAYSTFAAKGGRENLNRCVLVGHSMGGLMSRMMTIDSGEDFWNLVFEKPATRVDWPSAEAKNKFMTTLYFKRVPMVSAAVFIAAPHRGSGMADWFVVGWIKKLIKLPSSVASALVNVATLNMDGINQNFRSMTGVGTSLTGLSPKNPAFRTLNQRIIQVPFYTIIGDHTTGNDQLVYPNATLLAGNDTVVPYWSSHLNQAVSEKIIHAKHTSCTTYDGSLAEVSRILSERLAGKLGKAPTQPAGMMGPYKDHVPTMRPKVKIHPSGPHSISAASSNNKADKPARATATSKSKTATRMATTASSPSASVGGVGAPAPAPKRKPSAASIPTAPAAPATPAAKKSAPQPAATVEPAESASISPNTRVRASVL